MNYEEALQKAIAEAKDAQALSNEAISIARSAIADAKKARDRFDELVRQCSFVLSMVGGNASAMNAAVEWMGENMQPGDVFDAEKLEAWASAAGFKREE